MADLRPVPLEEGVTPESILGFQTVAFGVSRMRTIFVNLYAVETSDGGFVLVDTGMAGTAPLVMHAIARRFGAAAKPRAVLLTHAHIDHVGNAEILAKAYGAPVFVHAHERPYVTGESDYAPADPTPGGAIAFFSRFLSSKGTALDARIETLPEDGTVPELPGWRWIATPGHSAGHVAFFREADRLLLAGDAFATTDLDDWVAVNTWPRILSRSPLPFTPDWASARASVLRLADLDPALVAPGHGKPIEGGDLAVRLRSLAGESIAAPGGRYADRPATYGPDGGLQTVPPPRPDPLPRKLALAGAAVVAGVLLLRRKR